MCGYDGVVCGHIACCDLSLQAVTSFILFVARVTRFYSVSRGDNLDPVAGVRGAMPHFKKNMWLLPTWTLGLWKSDLEHFCLYIM